MSPWAALKPAESLKEAESWRRGEECSGGELMQTPGDGDPAGDLGQIPYKETSCLPLLEA